MSAAAAAVEFDGIGKLYHGRPLRRPLVALTEVSLRIEPGQVLGLLGPNRAGKTTLLKILLAVCWPTEGTLRRFGRPAGERGVLTRIGYVHENHVFPRYLSAMEVLDYFGTLSCVSRSDLKQRIPELLDRVGLADRAHEPIARFSKGMVQRLGLAQALVNRPELLVLDEPTEGLDFEGRRVIRQLIVESKRDQRTVILVSHVLAEIEAVCDYLAVLRQGRLIYSGAVSGLTAGRPLEAALESLYAEHERR